jgi:hypothetical protein
MIKFIFFLENKIKITRKHSFYPAPLPWWAFHPLTPQLLLLLSLSQLIFVFFFFSLNPAVVGVAAQTWFMRNIYSLNLQFLSFFKERSFPSGIDNISLGPLIFFVPNKWSLWHLSVPVECYCRNALWALILISTFWFKL